MRVTSGKSRYGKAACPDEGDANGRANSTARQGRVPKMIPGHAETP